MVMRQDFHATAKIESLGTLSPRPLSDIVVDSGESFAWVPFLTCWAANVSDISVSASQSDSSTSEGGLSLKIGGAGLDASAKVTITTDQELDCGAGESATAYVKVPVLWERRSPEGNDDIAYDYLEPLAGDGDLEIEVRPGQDAFPALSRVTVRSTGAAGLTVHREYTITAGIGLTVGVETSLTVSTETSRTVSLSASLPGGKTYSVDWLGLPSGVRVIAA